VTHPPATRGGDRAGPPRSLEARTHLGLSSITEVGRNVPALSHKGSVLRTKMCANEIKVLPGAYVCRTVSTACAEPSDPAGLSGLWPMPPARAAAGVCAGRAALPGGLRPACAPSARRGMCARGRDPGVLRYTGHQAATVLQERDELALGLGIPFDVALRHGEADNGRRVPARPADSPDRGHCARGADHERPAAGMRRTAVHLA